MQSVQQWEEWGRLGLGCGDQIVVRLGHDLLVRLSEREDRAGRSAQRHASPVGIRGKPHS